MHRLNSYVVDRWIDTDGRASLTSAVTGAEVAVAGASGVDRKAALAHARVVGGPALRQLTFAQRGELLTKLSGAIHGLREELVDLSLLNYGATRGDAKYDIDGAAGTLAHYGALGAKLGDARHQLDGEPEAVGRSARFVGHHLLVPKVGVAVHINAFNFPAWGMGEKLAVSLLAGVPALVKPATSTALVTWRIVQAWVEQGLLPPGALALLCGEAGDLLDHLESCDVVTFTGSADTGRLIRGHRRVVEAGVPVNVEADSLNAAVLGPDAEPGEPTFEMFAADVVRDLTQKAGQKCTATRRILVPSSLLEAVTEALGDRLAGAPMGDPAAKGVAVGPVATAAQARDVAAGAATLAASHAVLLRGSGEALVGGYYVQPTLFVSHDGVGAAHVHDHEVFGPVATVLTYDGSAEAAVKLVAAGGGALVTSLYSDDLAFAGEVLLGVAPWTGRVYWGSKKVADQGVGPGTVLPSFTHGGPGRAGGGEELGGLRGLRFYQQRVAIQGDRALVERVLAGS